jgi:hypothetical protein
VCCGCKTQYVEVERVRIDTTYITQHQRDSIYLHDSTYVHEYIHGDTIYVEVDRWKTHYIERTRHDTIYKHKVDSVPMPYPVEKKLSFRQRIAINCFPWVLLLLIASGIWIFRKRIFKI